MLGAKAGSCRVGTSGTPEPRPSSILAIPATRNSRILIGKEIIRTLRNSNKQTKEVTSNREKSASLQIESLAESNQPNRLSTVAEENVSPPAAPHSLPPFLLR